MENRAMMQEDRLILKNKGMPVHEFWPIKLKRRMHLYRDTIGLKVGQAAVPDLDFLYKILTAYPSHQAMLRGALKSGYKSLENYLRGNKRVSSAKVAQLATQSGISLDWLLAAPHGRKNGPLWPELQHLLWWTESIAAASFGFATSTTVLCPNCGGHVIEDVDPWWNSVEKKYGLRLDPAEYRFAERMLRALVGYCVIIFALTSIGSDCTLKGRMGKELLYLANASKHPIGTWLGEVMEARRCSTLYELLIASPIIDEKADGLSRQRLKAWSSGQELIPFATGQDLARDLPNSSELLLHFRLARCVAFVQDFIASAAAVVDETLSKHADRHIVFDRLECLFLNVGLSRYVAAGGVLRPKPAQ